MGTSLGMRPLWLEPDGVSNHQRVGDGIRSECDGPERVILTKQVTTLVPVSCSRRLAVLGLERAPFPPASRPAE